MVADVHDTLVEGNPEAYCMYLHCTFAMYNLYRRCTCLLYLLCVCFVPMKVAVTDVYDCLVEGTPEAYCMYMDNWSQGEDLSFQTYR